MLAEVAAIDAGVPPFVAARAAGHREVIQKRHYGHSGADHARRAALARALAGPPG